MTKPEITKKLFADALKELATKSHIEGIRTRDIIRASGLSAKTFYHHFKDKYELIAWIFHTEIEEVIVNFAKNDTGISNNIKKIPLYNKPFYITAFNQDQICGFSGNYWKLLAKYFYDNRKFYTNVLNSTSQNNLRDYLYELFSQQFRAEIIQILGDREMEPLDIDFLTQYFTNACVGYLFRWVLNGMRESPGSLHNDYSLITQNCMKFVVNLYVSKNLTN